MTFVGILVGQLTLKHMLLVAVVVAVAVGVPVRSYRGVERVGEFRARNRRYAADVRESDRPLRILGTVSETSFLQLVHTVPDSHLDDFQAWIIQLLHQTEHSG